MRTCCAAESEVTDAVFNIGTNTETSLLELAEALLAVMGRSDLAVEFGPARAVNGVTRRIASIEAAREQLGWKPEVDLHAGLRTLVDWWRARAGARMIPVMKPWLGEEEAQAAAEAVTSGWVAQGPRVAEFETRFAERVGAEHGVAVSSCTTALHLCLHLLGIGPGDEVVVPSFSFIATANCAVYVGATPVFADVEPEDGNLSVAPSSRS